MSPSRKSHQNTCYMRLSFGFPIENLKSSGSSIMVSDTNITSYLAQSPDSDIDCSILAFFRLISANHLNLFSNL